MTAIISCAAVLVSVVFGYFSAKRSQYERVLNVIDHISSSVVAQSRHELGTIIHNPEHNIEDPNARIQDLFIILWAFNRINAVRLTLPSSRVIKTLRIDGPTQLLEDSTSDWVKLWHKNYQQIAERLGAIVGDASKGIEALADVWLKSK